ncbi:MAG: tetraacyldisaccharide 4'-kinase [Polaribacter sp.]|nr:tetraacyldisaccharide 4'-kinase [Polaribacter sp.]
MKFVRFILFPFSIIYHAITAIRNFLFDVGIFKQTGFKVPIIIVGNLGVGGTGKTPQIEYLIRLLKDSFKVAVLSRGYKRKTDGYILLNEKHSALDVGDEPLQYFKKFNNINVAVDANRVKGVNKLISQKSPEVILLDDAYQHRKIRGSFYILLTKFDDLFIDDYLLPAGNLRESRNGASRTDVIVVTKCPSDLSIKSQQFIQKRLQKFNKQVYFSKISYGKIKSSKNQFSIDEISNYKVLLITGIANPKPLLLFLDKNQVSYKHFNYPDHHHFSAKELKATMYKFDEIKSNKKILLTTEKDYIRLQGSLSNLYFIEIETSFLANGKDIFNNQITIHLNQYNY